MNWPKPANIQNTRGPWIGVMPFVLSEAFSCVSHQLQKSKQRAVVSNLTKKCDTEGHPSAGLKCKCFYWTLAIETCFIADI